MPVFLLALALLGVLCGACKPERPKEYAPEYSVTSVRSQPVYLFGVHPLHNPQRLHETYGPLMAYLNRNLRGARVELEASRSYEEYDKKLCGRHFHFALPNPYQTINALDYGYRVFGKMGNDSKFRGIIIVRKDSGIADVGGLKGKTVSFPAPTALAATMMPLYYLHTHGVDVNHDIQRLYAGSQESSIMNVYLGKSAAGATWPPPWEAFMKRYPDIAAELVVRWETPSLVNNGLIVRDDVPREIADKVADLLLRLHASEEGRKLLANLPLERFEPATKETYGPVYGFMKTYREVVR